MTAKQAKNACLALDLTIRVGKTVYPAIVRGSMEPFAIVWPNCGGSLLLGRYEYSWEAIAHAATTGEPLKV